MFKDTLIAIQKDLNAHRDTRANIIEKCIRERLNDSLLSYDKDLDYAYQRMVTIDTLKAMRTINKG